LSSRAPIGYLAITAIPLAINQGFIAIIPKNNISNYHIYLWCKQNMEIILSMANGSTFLEISKSSFKSIEIYIPPTKLLLKFNEYISYIFNKIELNQRQIKTLSIIRDILIPKLLNGIIKVNQ
jgi:type I restriction enzyme S subunit